MLKTYTGAHSLSSGSFSRTACQPKGRRLENALGVRNKWKPLSIDLPNAFPSCTVLLPDSPFAMMDTDTYIKVIGQTVRPWECRHTQRYTHGSDFRHVLGWHSSYVCNILVVFSTLGACWPCLTPMNQARCIEIWEISRDKAKDSCKNMAGVLTWKVYWNAIKMSRFIQKNIVSTLMQIDRNWPLKC